MAVVNWGNVGTDVATYIVISIISGGIGFFNGKKKSSKAVERKEEIYLPLIDELTTSLTIKAHHRMDLKLLKEIHLSAYKYGLSHELQRKCDQLMILVDEYNKINLLMVAHSVIVKTFIDGYTDLFGSIVEAYVDRDDPDGNTWEEQVVAEPVEVIKEINFEKYITNLLNREGDPDYTICVDEEFGYIDYVYEDLVKIYRVALNVEINGKKYKLPERVIKINMADEEYIAYQYDYFKQFNSDERVIKKYKLREEIYTLANGISGDLKVIVKKIVQKYEKEE